MWADTRSLTGANLKALQERGVTLFAPSRPADPTTNPARRADLSQPVPADQRDQLPTKTTKHKDGTKTTQLTKDAFVYDRVKDCFWCPHGQQLKFRTATKENPETRSVDRRIYAAPASACADCPLRAKCLNEKSKADHREINRDEHDDRLAAHARRMTTLEAKQKYAVRKHRGERPFAHIKHHFGARSFPLRSLKKVRLESSGPTLSGPHTYSCVVGLMTNSATWARGGRAAMATRTEAMSSGWRIFARCSTLTGTGRASRIGVSTSPG